MGKNTRYIHIFQSTTFPRKPYSGIGVPYFPSRSTRRFPLLVFCPSVSAFRSGVPMGGKIASMIKQPIVSSIVPPIVASLLVPSPVPFLSPFPPSRSSHPSISSPSRLSHPPIPSCVRSSRPVPAVPPFRPSLSFRLLSSRPSPRYLDKLSGA